MRGAAETAEKPGETRLGSVRVPRLQSRPGSEGAPRAGLESAGREAKQIRNFDLTDAVRRFESCNVFTGASWLVVVIGSLIGKVLVRIIFLSGFNAASHLPALVQQTER